MRGCGHQGPFPWLQQNPSIAKWFKMGPFFPPLQQDIPNGNRGPRSSKPYKTPLSKTERRSWQRHTRSQHQPRSCSPTTQPIPSFFCTGPLLPYSQGFPPRFFPGNTPMGLSCPVPAPFPGVTLLPPHLWRGNNFFFAVLVLFYCYYSFKVRIKERESWH